MWATSLKYFPKKEKNRYVLDNKSRKQCNIIFINAKLAIQVIMEGRTTLLYKFKARLKFKQNDVILTKEQWVLTKTVNSFDRENMQTEHMI